MLDHISIKVGDFEKSKKFYREALAPFGYVLVMEFPHKVAGFGTKEKPFFWIAQGEVPNIKSHIAFAAENRQLVDKFYHAARTAGGADNGKPGLRKDYHENYYGAFILDPDGYNIEAVCHKPEKE